MSERPPIVFVVDDDASVRRSVARLLKAHGYQPQVFASAQDFLQHEGDHGPGCLVLDLQLPGLSGLDLQAELAAADRAIPIVFISGHGDIPSSVRAMKAGAVDFLAKPFRAEVLLEAVRAALARDIRERHSREAVDAVAARLETLTARERQVLALVVTGKLNKQIAHELGTTEKTVKVHRSRAMHKLGASSVAELVRLAEKVGIRPPEP
jgi:FixJ family two-component response regulator